MDNVFQEIDIAADLDNTLFWRLINRQKGKRTNECSEIEANGRILTNPNDISDAFAAYYESVLTPSENANFDNAFKKTTKTEFCRMYDSIYNCSEGLANLTLSVSTISKIITSLNMNRAAGIDSVRNEHLKHWGPYVSQVLKFLFDKVLEFQYVPEVWKIG